MPAADSFATPVSMLWESADPVAALHERFGFASATDAERWLQGVLAERWGLRVDSCERLVISSANALAWVVVDGCRMIAKWSMRAALFPRLASIARLTEWLGEQGMPVSAPVPARDGSLQVEVDGFSLGLQRVIEGELLDITGPGQVRAAGEMLARMHLVMADYPGTVPTDVPSAPGFQLVGNDFRAANILWAEGKIAAVLDLEEATYRRRVDDLAQAAVLLGTRYHDWAPTPADVRARFVGAYASILPPTSEDAALLEEGIETCLRAMGWGG